MLASITPLGERARRANWATTTAIFIVGSTLGGAVLGALTGLTGSAVLGGAGIRGRLAVIAGALAVGLAWELAREGVPGPRRQVDERWLDRYRSWFYGLAFGVQLGTGVATVVVSSAVYAVWVAAFASAQLEAGAAIGAVAGAFRGATLLAGATLGTPDRLIAFHERMRILREPVRAAALAAQLVLMGLALLAVVG
jgi:hypothetical protein